jgi:hypothetical protein
MTRPPYMAPISPPDSPTFFSVFTSVVHDREAMSQHERLMEQIIRNKLGHLPPLTFCAKKRENGAQKGFTSCERDDLCRGCVHRRNLRSDALLVCVQCYLTPFHRSLTTELQLITLTLSYLGICSDYITLKAQVCHTHKNIILESF